MGKIVGERLQPYVIDQIKVRQNAHGSGTDGTTRTLNQLTYLNSKTAWVKLASGVQISKDRLTDEQLRADGFQGDSLAKQHILFGGTSTRELDEKGQGILKPRGTYDPTKASNIWNNYWGTYNVNASTNPSEFGLVPMPGITSVDVKCLNRGSIKRATINLKCYSPEQFKIIDLLYLRIGYTMLLEWGNSLYLEKDDKLSSMQYTLTEAENYGFYSGKWKESSYLGFLPIIEWYRKNRKGNYDALLCKVVNFNWTFSQDGSYDINLELISLGDVIESLKINIPPSQNVISFIDQTYSLYNDDADVEASIPPSPSDNWVSAYLFLQKLYIDKENNPQTGYSAEERYNTGGTGNSSTNAIAGKLGEGEYAKVLDLGGVFAIPPSGSIQLGITSTIKIFETKQEAINWLQSQNITPTPIETESPQPNTNSYFLRDDLITGEIKLFLSTYPELDPLALENPNKKDIVYFSYNWGDTDEDQNIEDKGFYMRFGHLLQFIKDYVVPTIENTNTPILEIDNDMWTNKMYTLPYQVSLDPRVCIVNAAIEPVNSKQFFPNLINWKYISNDNTKAHGLTMNIYINHSQIMSSLNENKNEKGNVDLFGFLNSLCTAINKAMGGINNLEPIYDEDTHTIAIIDGSYSKLEDPGYQIELYGYNKNTSNFVRNFNLKTEITNDFATMATIGSTAGGYTKGVENTMFSKWNKGLTDPWKEKYVPPKNAREQGSDSNEPVKMYVKDFWNATYAAWGYVLKDVTDDLFTSDKASLSDEIIEKNLNIVSEFYKYCQSKIQEKEEQYSSPTNGFVPISLGLTMDGLSGIKIYNEINVDTRFLPQNYSNNLRFIVKGVNHKLSNSDWETSIETVVISQSGDRNRTPLSYSRIKQIIDEQIKEGIAAISDSEENNGINAPGVRPQGKPSKNPPSDLIKAMKDYGIVNPLEKAHFLAQVAHESAEFYYKEEIASGKAYEGRKDLGNTQKGDGVKYKGRGYIQVTGRENYTAYNKYLKSRGINDDVVANPKLVATKFAADSAAWYWKVYGPKFNKDFPSKSAQGDTLNIIDKIGTWVNGGNPPNGAKSRRDKFAYYWDLLKKNPNAFS